MGNDGYIHLARTTVAGEAGVELEFEAYIEDDGTCVDLLGPYDHRDGKFQNLEGCENDEF